MFSSPSSVTLSQSDSQSDNLSVHTTDTTGSSLSEKSLQSFQLAPQSLPNYNSHGSKHRDSISNPIRRIEVRQDRFSGEQFVLLKDIQVAFKTADFVVDGESGYVVPFLLNDDFEELTPLRIAYHPDKVLDVVLTTTGSNDVSRVATTPVAARPPSLPTPHSIPARISSLAATNNHDQVTQKPKRVSASSTSTTSSIAPMLKIEQVSTAHHKGDFALEYHDQFSKEPPKVMPRTRGNPTHTGNGNSNNDNSSNCNNAVISWRARESIQSFNDLRSSYIEAFLAGQVLQAEGIKGEMSKHFEDLKTETDKLQASVEKNNELQAVNSDLLRQVHDMNETMLNMQQKALDRLANLQTRIQAVLTQTYQLHEYPIPRLFIILPRAARRRDAILKPLAYQFRLYFLCECGPHTTQAGSKETDKVHMANHPGYDLERPTEFFNRYGHYILLVMRALQLGVRLASVVIPHLASSTLAQELKQAERGLQFQQQTGHDFYTNDNIGAMMDRTISYLEDRTRHHHGLGGYGKKHDESNPTSDASSILSDAELIEGVELKKLERFLVSVDKNRTLGNLYRTVTREGHVKWVCRTHFRQNYREQARMRFLDVVQENGGSYNEPQGQVILNLASRTLAKAFYTALVQTHGVQELDVTLTWDATLADLRAFAEAIIKSTVMNLTFHGWHLRGPATDYFNRNRQYEPLLQIFAEGRIQIVQVWGLPNLFERCASLISSSSNNKMASTLRVLDMCLITEESGSMFLEMLKRCPVLQKLTVNAPNEGIVLGSIRNCPSLREMVVRQDSLSMKNILKLTNEVVVLKRQRCYQQHGKDYLLRLGSLIITTETDSVLSSFSAEGLSGITPLLSNDHDLQVLLEEYGWAMDHLDLSSSAQKVQQEKAEWLAWNQVCKPLDLQPWVRSIDNHGGVSFLKSLRFNGTLLLRHREHICSILEMSSGLKNLELVLGSLRSRQGLDMTVGHEDSLEADLSDDVVWHLQHLGPRLTKLDLLGRTAIFTAAEFLSRGPYALPKMTELRLTLEDAPAETIQDVLGQENLARFLNALDFSVVKFLGIYQCKVSFENWHVLLDRLSMYSSSSSLPHDQGAMMAVETIEFVKTGLEQTRKATDGTMQTQLTHRAPLARLIVE